MRFISAHTILIILAPVAAESQHLAFFFGLPRSGVSI